MANPLPSLPMLPGRFRQIVDIDDLAIPRDVQVAESWAPMLLELAEHIGAYAALRLCEEFPGYTILVPKNPARSPFVGIIDPDKVAKLSFIYGTEDIIIPTGRNAILRAKRAGIIAAIRSGALSVMAAARILRARRSHISRLVNQTDEGVGIDPVPLPEPRVLVVLRNAAAVASATLATAGASAELIADTENSILAIWFGPSIHSNGEHHVQAQE